MALDSDRFESLDALRTRHQELLSSSQSKDQSLSSVPTSTIKEFLSRAAATGAIIMDPRERRTVQACMRFWAAELITRGEADWTLPALAAPELDSAKPETSAAQVDAASDRDLARSRTLVRISASARQWRESGKDRGWLLMGDALRDAEQFAGEDDDIRALVDASRAAQSRTSRWRTGVLTILVIILGGMCAALLWA